MILAGIGVLSQLILFDIVTVNHRLNTRGVEIYLSLSLEDGRHDRMQKPTKISGICICIDTSSHFPTMGYLLRILFYYQLSILMIVNDPPLPV